MGDNGTLGQVAQTPYSSSSTKGSLKQGGINVPLFVSGKNVTRIGNDNNLITSTDLFATIANLAKVNVSEINDNQSFKNLLTSDSNHRNYQYSEKDDGINSWVINDGNYKTDENGLQEFYNLVNDPYEETNLLNGNLTSEQVNIIQILENEFNSIRN